MHQQHLNVGVHFGQVRLAAHTTSHHGLKHAAETREPYERTHLRGGIERVSRLRAMSQCKRAQMRWTAALHHLNILNFFNEFGNEAVVDAALHEQTRPAKAYLALQCHILVATRPNLRQTLEGISARANLIDEASSNRSL